MREAHLQRTFGISLEQFDALLAKQMGHCAICHSTEPGGLHGQWEVDHDHKTGKVRGLLCRGCNVGLAMFRDDATIMRAAARYLKV